MASKILIIEDNRNVRDVLVQMLSISGYRAFGAADGRSGLLKFGLVQPDLVILDIRLPGMDGWETLQRIREISTVPVIVLTVVNDEEAKVKSLRLGADHFMTKPFSTQELQARVRALLRRSQDTQQTVATTHRWAAVAAV